MLARLAAVGAARGGLGHVGRRATGHVGRRARRWAATAAATVALMDLQAARLLARVAARVAVAAACWPRPWIRVGLRLGHFRVRLPGLRAGYAGAAAAAAAAAADARGLTCARETRRPCQNVKSSCSAAGHRLSLSLRRTFAAAEASWEAVEEQGVSEPIFAPMKSPQDVWETPMTWPTS